MDVDLLYQTITILFIEGKQSEYISVGRDKYSLFGKMEQVDHQKLLNALDSVCNETDFPELFKMHYLFFVANVASKCNTSLDAQYYFRLTKELLSMHHIYLEFNENLLSQSNIKGNLKETNTIKHQA